MKDLSVLCLNCFGSPISSNILLRFKLIAKEIEKLSPDLVMLQEVISPNYMKILHDELDKFGWKFYSSRSGLFVSGGLVIISKNLELKNLEFHKFKVQGPITLLSLTDRILGKGFQTVECKINGKDILLINTHLLCLYSKRKRDYEAQEKQLNQLSDFITAKNADNIILAGDLNNDPDSAMVLNFKNKHNFIDTLNTNAITVDSNNLNRKGLLKLFGNDKPYRTDYVFVAKGMNIDKGEVIFKDPQMANDKNIHLSDHYGIILKLRI
jgi:endonuclease/exonuclease/phosphatase family metal-dependent hydrolase